MKWLLALWLFLAANLTFGQEADLGIGLKVRPSLILALDQIGFLDVIITNHGPNEKAGTFFLETDGSSGFQPIIFGGLLAGQCHQNPSVEPPPPGVPYFGAFDTTVLSVGESELCTFAFQLDGNQPQSANIVMKVVPWQFQQSADPNQSNNVASITVMFLDSRPVPAIGSIALWMLSSLILLTAGIRIHYLDEGVSR
jgi:hypothetical protein